MNLNSEPCDENSIEDSIWKAAEVKIIQKMKGVNLFHEHLNIDEGWGIHLILCLRYLTDGVILSLKN